MNRLVWRKAYLLPLLAALACSRVNPSSPTRPPARATTASSPTSQLGRTTTTRRTTSLPAGAPTAASSPATLPGKAVSFDTGKQPTSVIHVAVGGHDDTGDGSAANPYASLERAAQAATPGADIRIHAGTYPGGQYIENLAGTSDTPIWIGGAPGESRPILSGGSEGIHLVGARYVIIHDLEVSNTDDNGINSDDGGDYANPQAAHDQIFRNITIHDVGGTGNQDCLKLSGINNYSVLNSEFAFCGGAGSGSGIDHVGCHHGVIEQNFFHDNSANAIQLKGGSEDILVQANRMLNSGERAINIGGSTDFQYFRPPLSTTQPNFEARNIRVIANVIQGSVAPLAFVGAVDSLAANNTLVDPTNWLLRILQETTTSGGYEFLPSGNNIVMSNLFYFNRSDLSDEDINIGPDTAPGTFVFTNNLWYAHDDPAQSQPHNLPVTETNGLAGLNPLLLSPSGQDFHLQAGSPAIGSGISMAGVVTDFDGKLYNLPPSIGAFEGNPLVLAYHTYLAWVSK